MYKQNQVYPVGKEIQMGRQQGDGFQHRIELIGVHPGDAIHSYGTSPATNQRPAIAGYGTGSSLDIAGSNVEVGWRFSAGYHLMNRLNGRPFLMLVAQTVYLVVKPASSCRL
tara:strand:+ start:147 stop:482 length:336 start_codon:yes stop_codon:yes gene_type:complete